MRLNRPHHTGKLGLLNPTIWRSDPAELGGQTGLRIEHKLRTGHHLIAHFQATEDLHLIGILSAKLYPHRLILSASSAHHHPVKLTAVDHRLARDKQAGLACIGLQLQLGIHIGLKPLISIIELNSDLQGAALRIQLGIDVIHFPLPKLARIAVNLHHSTMAKGKLLGLGFKQLSNQPDLVEPGGANQL